MGYNNLLDMIFLNIEEEDDYETLPFHKSDLEMLKSHWRKPLKYKTAKAQIKAEIKSLKDLAKVIERTRGCKRELFGW